MRTTTDAKGNVRYSPDDGDQTGFIALLTEWAGTAPIHRRDIESFAADFSHTTSSAAEGDRKRLRTPREWVRMLKSSAGCP